MDARDVFAYVVMLRWRVLDALRDVQPQLLVRPMATNHGSILGTLIHIMAVEQSWISEDLQGEPQLTMEAFMERYLDGRESIDAVISGWHRVTDDTVRQIEAESDLSRRVAPVPAGNHPDVTLEQILLHLAGEEMIHMGEVLAMTRQVSVDLPSYFLMSIMTADDRPWEQLRASLPVRPD